MASPMPTAPHGGWNPNGQMIMQQNNEVDESGVQVRPMGLKVHYTFDKEAKVNCLARSSQTFHVQTIPLDDKNSIGVVDLRVCLQAVTECSPELASSASDSDFTVYALDYSEPDTPLVGQGMLSWVLESMRGDWAAHPPKVVTGRVTKNLLAVFGGGNRETLEVKLKLTATAKVQRPEPSMDLQLIRPTETAMMPAGAAEWNSFIQSNPQIGHSAHVSRVASPALSQGPPTNTLERRDSFGPSVQGASGAEVQRIAPIPVDPTAVPIPPASRPSSRSSRKKKPTGRPRGRPRKKPAEGNTSGYEDGTEGEDGGPAKRAKTTKVEKAAPNPFTSGPDSLRVTASTAGSLRNFRPVGVNNEVVAGNNHLQEVPRAPTPVPEGGPLSVPARGGPKGSKPRRESSMRKELTANLSNQFPPRPNRALSPSQEDGRSPESPVETAAYSDESPQDIRSSPPVPRTASFLRSSPPPSSPILPPMPVPRRQDSVENDVDDLFDEPILQPVKESRLRGHDQAQKVIETADCTGIPSQVFKIQDGLDVQNLIHLQNYNTPHPTSAPAGPPQTEALSLPPLVQKNPLQPPQPTQNAPQKQEPHTSPPVLAPTPPPTTDAPEKTASPAPASVPSPVEVPQLEISQTVEDVEEALLQLVRETSGSSEPLPSTETNHTPQGPLPPPAPASSSLHPQPRAKRHLNRSQSAGALALPSVPASEPAGPSNLSQSTLAKSTRASTEIPAVLRRSNSISLHLPIPASDPVGSIETSRPLPLGVLSEAPCPASDFPPMPSSPPFKSNKNQVKKQSIRLRLENAVQNGEMPPFCTNCGAIETPTWRKIWVQEHEGVPEYVEYSEKPGRITAIEILKRDEENKPLSYRLIKKSLGGGDSRKAWTEQLLCNPCGIWITKYRTHRPQNKWGNASGPLGQGRRKRASGGSNPQAKRARTKSISQPNPTSEAYLATDPLGPIQPSSPKQFGAEFSQASLSGDFVIEDVLALLSDNGLANHDISRSNPGSTHSRVSRVSRGSGTAESPIEMDLDNELGTTRRLLFPSPRKDATPKTLGEINANIVKTPESRQNKELVAEKENVVADGRNESQIEHDDLEALFNSPSHARPSTPPPKAKATSQTTPFKTPTRPTPSHRPITRSVSRSLRSVRDKMSPSQQALLQKTPTRTPHGSATVRRSPRLNLENVFDTPLSRTITQMLSEPNFDLGNGNFDFSNLPALDANNATLIEFGNFLSTDGIMPSSPPKDGSTNFGYSGADNVWAEWVVEQKATKTEE
ncbi:CENP-A multicopy suppressor 2 [Fusarium albosuccineum]|uniref:CENP-A multicopy suppressor 2 n=1 Tax=Fusarium albosuccineum TaxID=1237068 RepID=A0A8H4PAP3_9HYPO|nr:CENP-A multicopy suppressor 2 [Fusarium albosuccineum]